MAALIDAWDPTQCYQHSPKVVMIYTNTGPMMWGYRYETQCRKCGRKL